MANVRYYLRLSVTGAVLLAGWSSSIMLFREGLALLAVLVAIALPMLLLSFFSFDEIVKFEYANHRGAWERDGKPSGFYWRAPECTWWSSGLAMQRLNGLWLFRTPNWARKPSPVYVWVVRFRSGVVAWNAFFVLTIAAVLLAQVH